MSASGGSRVCSGVVPTIAVCAMAITTWACSYVAAFVVSNETDNSADVRVSFDPAAAGAAECGALEPRPSMRGPVVVPTARLESWHEARQEEYLKTYEAASCAVALTVPPRHSAVIWRLFNYSDRSPVSGSSLRTDTFPTAIVVEGAAGRVQLEGPHLHRLFREVDRNLYVLSYGRSRK